MNSAKNVSGVAYGASFVEGLTGLAVIALSIIGLARIWPVTLASISTIVLGAAFVFEAGAVSARFAALAEDETRGITISKYGSMTSEFVAGVAGIVLGILALLGIAPMYLVPISAIIFGGALVMDSGVRVSLSRLEAEQTGLQGLGQNLAEESATASSSIQIFVGLGAVALGILAIVGLAPLQLSLIALLCAAAAILLVSTVVGTRMRHMLRP